MDKSCFCNSKTDSFIETMRALFAGRFATQDIEWYYRIIPLLFFGLNVYLNAWKVVKVGPNSPNASLLPIVQKAGYRFCYECNFNAPPRSFHCPDHHCSFVGCCVGHFNQRYFVAAIFNLLPITITCVIWNIFMLIPIFNNLFNIWKVIFPHLALLIGAISFYQFILIATFAFSVTTLTFNIYLIIAQLFCLLFGQTRVEYLQNINIYNLGIWKNLNETLGEKWPFIFISPFIKSPLRSDGHSFITREMQEARPKYF
uniref:Palmitoyltransferase n=1 Tax=Meloidogyne hapla TaxID=6305 RepID=A0A1I8C1M8_MELHA